MYKLDLIKDVGAAIVSGVIAATIAKILDANNAICLIVGLGMFIAVICYKPDRDEF